MSLRHDITIDAPHGPGHPHILRCSQGDLQAATYCGPQVAHALAHAHLTEVLGTSEAPDPELSPPGSGSGAPGCPLSPRASRPMQMDSGLVEVLP